jgi:imidazoleglycerol phosphate synthase glutamine amidotransferase subunit HisH
MIAIIDYAAGNVKSVENAVRKLGFETLLNEPMTLTAIYNQSEKDFLQKKNIKSIGFKVSA